tara:strand:+ start:4993 stop:5790 length:798 start_codon:yes stop_codon:yes gene_type:complete
MVIKKNMNVVEYIRPIEKVSLLNKILFKFSKQEVLQAYNLQRLLEKSFLTGKELNIPNRFKISDNEIQNDLVIYKGILGTLKNLKTTKDNFALNSNYANTVFGVDTLSNFKKKFNYSNKFERSKILFNKSIKKIQLNQVEFALKPAKKALKKTSWYSLFYFHVELVKLLEKSNEIFSLLEGTLVLTRFNKRVKFYGLIKDQLDKAHVLFKLITPVYETKDSEVIKKWFANFNESCVESIKKDQEHFNLDDEDKEIITNLIKSFSR